MADPGILRRGPLNKIVLNNCMKMKEKNQTDSTAPL